MQAPPPSLPSDIYTESTHSEPSAQNPTTSPPLIDMTSDEQPSLSEPSGSSSLSAPPPTEGVNEEQEILINREQENSFGPFSLLKPSFWRYYFDVDTFLVFRRILNSLKINKYHNYLSMCNGKPDLYGPFWIITTTILFVGIFSNMTMFLESLFVNDKAKFHWRFV